MRTNRINLQPRVTDYLFGKQKSCKENGGNKFIRQLVEEVFEEYEAASDHIDFGFKRDKLTIKMEIMAAFKAGGGRFLKQNRCGDWIEVSSADATRGIVEEFRSVRKDRKGKPVESLPIPSIVSVEGSTKLPPVAEVAVETATSDEQTCCSASSSAQPQSENGENDNSFVQLTLFDIDDSIASKPRALNGDDSPAENDNFYLGFGSVDEVSTLGDEDLCGLALVHEWPKSPCTPRALRLEPSGSSSRKPISMESGNKSTPDFSWTLTASHLGRPLSIESKPSPQAPLTLSQKNPTSLGTFSYGTSSTACPVIGFTPWSRGAAATVTDLPYRLAARDQQGAGVIDEIPHDVLRQALKELKAIITSSETSATELVGFLVHHMTSPSSPASESDYFCYVGARVLVRAMQQYPANENLQSRCCYALATIVPKYDCKLAIVKNGGIGLLLVAMADFRLNERLQEDVCHALAILSRDHDNKVAIEKEGGIGLVLRAMRTYYSNRNLNLQLYCCWALANLGTVERNRVVIAKKGGIGLLLKAMKGFSAHEEVQRHVCLALGNLAQKNQKNAKIIRDSGGEQLVKEAMSHSKASEDLIVRAYFALESFTIKPSVPRHERQR